MRAPRAALLALTLATGLVTGCGGAPSGPQTTASAYLAAWGRQDWAAMRQLTSDPPADFTPVNQAAFGDLTVRRAAFTAGTMHTSGAAASAPITERLTLARGTAAGQGLPAGTYAKTGTAQYGTTKPLKTDAWLVGFKGDIAFAALVADSAGNGGPTCGPIVAKFLNGI